MSMHEHTGVDSGDYYGSNQPLLQEVAGGIGRLADQPPAAHTSMSYHIHFDDQEQPQIVRGANPEDMVVPVAMLDMAMSEDSLALTAKALDMRQISYGMGRIENLKNMLRAHFVDKLIVIDPQFRKAALNQQAADWRESLIFRDERPDDQRTSYRPSTITFRSGAEDGLYQQAEYTAMSISDGYVADKYGILHVNESVVSATRQFKPDVERLAFICGEFLVKYPDTMKTIMSFRYTDSEHLGRLVAGMEINSLDKDPSEARYMTEYLFKWATAGQAALILEGYKIFQPNPRSLVDLRNRLRELE